MTADEDARRHLIAGTCWCTTCGRRLTSDESMQMTTTKGGARLHHGHRIRYVAPWDPMPTAETTLLDAAEEPEA